MPVFGFISSYRSDMTSENLVFVSLCILDMTILPTKLRYSMCLVTKSAHVSAAKLSSSAVVTPGYKPPITSLVTLA